VSSIPPHRLRSNPEVLVGSGWHEEVYDWAVLREALPTQAAAPTVVVDVMRHAQTTANARGLVSGASDVPLTDLGREQARALAPSLATAYELAFHSPLVRSRETLELALDAADTRVGLVLSDRRLAERSLGVLEGRPAEPIPAYDAGDLTYAPAGGDDYLVVTRRVLSFLLHVRAAATRAGQPLRVLVSSHMGPMRILLAVLEGVVDPVTVLTGRFANARLRSVTMASIPWPAFVPTHPVQSRSR
jgi:2,3-bisphosphoglycerate-dependent phosphoglycerate mutase